MNKINIVSLQNSAIKNIAQIDETGSAYVVPELVNAQYVISSADGEVSAEAISFVQDGNDLRIVSVNDSPADITFPNYFSSANHISVLDSHGDYQTIDSAQVSDNGELQAVATSPAENILSATVTHGVNTLAASAEPAAPSVAEEPVAKPALTAASDSPFAIDDVVDDQGNQTGSIENGGYTDDTMPTISGHLEGGSTLIVELYNNGNLVGKATIGDDDTWTITPEGVLEPVDGTYSFLAMVTDPVGKQTYLTLPYEVNFAPEVVPVATIDSLFDDTGSYKGEVASGGVTDDSTPTVQGSATAGSVVSVYDGETLLGSTVAGPDGKWVYAPTAVLAEGEHAFTAVPVYNNTQGETSAPFDVTIDITAPPFAGEVVVNDDVGAITGVINPGDVTDDNLPEFTGKSDAGNIITIYENGVPLGSTVTNEAGEWSFTPTEALPDGLHNFVSTVTDSAGNVSLPGFAGSFTVDTAVPDAPSIATPDDLTVSDDQGAIQGPVENGGMTDDTLPTFSGKGQTPGQIITVLDGGEPIGSAIVGPDGTWHTDPTAELAEGPHEITLTATDEAGNTSAPSDAFDFTVDTTAPVVPPIATPDDLTVSDDQGAVQGPVEMNGVTDDNLPTFSGKNQTPGDIITVLDGGEPIGSAVVAEDGTWQTDPTEPMADGPHDITLTASDSVGNTSAPSDAFNFTVDTTAPNVPSIATPDDLTVTDDQGAIQGPVDNGGVTDDTLPTFSGKGQTPGDIITVLDGGQPIGSAVVAEDGTWQTDPTAELAEGPHEITLTATDEVGNVSDPSDAFNFTVDTTAPDAPPIVTPDNLTVSDDQGAVQGPVENGGVTDDTLPTFSGKGQVPGEIITVLDGGQPIGSAVVAEDGTWQTDPTAELAEGPHDITLTATDEAGNVSDPSDAFNFTVDTTGVATPDNLTVSDDQGDIQGPIDNGGVTDDTLPTFSGKDQVPGDIITVLDGGQAIGSAVVAEDGTWQTDPIAELAEGPHDITLTATDEAGNVSAPSDAFNFTVDTTAPDAPPIVTPDNLTVSDDQGDIQGPIDNGGVTDDTLPTFSGKGQVPGEIITVLDGGQPIGSAVVAEDGTWQTDPTAELAEGPHDITLTATDEAGNVSDPSDAFNFTVDTTAPDAPPIVTPDNLTVSDDQGAVQGPVENGGVTDDTLPTFSGKGQVPGEIITVLDGGQPIGSAVVAEDGTWQTDPTAELAEGPHDITLTATDEAGNVSDPSDAFNFTVDTTAPDAPPIVTPDNLTVSDDQGAVQGPVENGGLTDDSLPTFSGKDQVPGQIITVLDGGQPIGSAVVAEDGTWQTDPTAALADGPHDITLTATDEAGNTSEPSDAFNFTVDTSAIVISIDGAYDDIAPIVGELENNSSTNDLRPELHGSATANSTVFIYDNDVKIGSTTSDADGKWTFTPASDLSEGANALTATVQTSVAGESEPSGIFTLDIDTTAPDAPAIATPDDLTVSDDQGTIQGPVENGGVTDDNLPTFSGKGQVPGEIITVLDGGKAIGSAVVAEDGTWKTDANAALADGPHDITLTATDAAGNTSDPSDPFNFTVDTTAPANDAVVINDNVGPDQGIVVPGGATDDTTPTFNGNTDPGSTVIISDNGEVIGSAVAGDDGKWDFTPETPLDTGPHDVTTETVDEAGNSSGPSEPTHFDVIVQGSDNFDTDETHVFSEGDSLALPTGLTITYTKEGVDGSANNTATEITRKGIALFTPEFGKQALVLLAESETKYEFGGLTNSVSFDVAGANYAGSSVSYYDAAGNLLHTTQIDAQAGTSSSIVDTIAWSAPAGELISYMTINVGPEGAGDTGIRVDGFTWGQSDIAPAQQSAELHSAEVPAHELATALLGTDAQHVDSSAISLESLNSNSTTEPGVVDIHELGKGTLALSVDDVLSHGEQNLFTDDGKTQLAITGEDGSQVELSGVNEASLQQTGSITESGVTYDVYNVANQNSELLVQHGIELHTV
ncbi:Ig-like domain-containing protein [Enterobacteriaceae bacterium H11S18]|uniref:Ig-like domain-containing protein n=1 Tax=Dryocola clanedunensis TaxID=2925396 RepID=UPI0022F05150|nr:Ig-like domain-containing protein [Dryocola clanedunensis]MCT4712784.1 Ig-like domain-containing protein [Dryocola clanedunensis]